MSSRFRVWMISKFRVNDLGFRVNDLGFRVNGIRV
jgi:hypothetical protein